MNNQTQKFTAPVRLSAVPGAPMYSSPWLALFSHLKANLGQR